jgi:hypothetical protein
MPQEVAQHPLTVERVETCGSSVESKAKWHIMSDIPKVRIQEILFGWLAELEKT